MCGEDGVDSILRELGDNLSPCLRSLGQVDARGWLVDARALVGGKGEELNGIPCGCLPEGHFRGIQISQGV